MIFLLIFRTILFYYHFGFFRFIFLYIFFIYIFSLTSNFEPKGIQIVEKKTGKFKKFPINAKLKLMLKDFTKGKKMTKPLFITKFKNRLERVAAYKIINAACKEAGLEERVGTHTLRKTFGYHHYQKFKDVVMLQKIFNHYSPEITLRYIGIEQSQIDESYTNFIL